MDTDRGWAWVVLAASFGSHFLNGALIFFVGVVHAGLLEKFKESVTTTAWVGSAYSALLCLTVPVSSLVIGRYGCRTCSAIGGVLCFIGFVSSAFATSIYQLFFTYGIVAAVGYALSSAPAYIAIGFYFDKLRGLASGISVTSAALGILSGPLVMQTLMDEYSLNGAFLLVGAISLHYTLFGMFYRPTVYETRAYKITKNTKKAAPTKETKILLGSGAVLTQDQICLEAQDIDKPVVKRRLYEDGSDPNISGQQKNNQTIISDSGEVNNTIEDVGREITTSLQYESDRLSDKRCLISEELPTRESGTKSLGFGVKDGNVSVYEPDADTDSQSLVKSLSSEDEKDTKTLVSSLVAEVYLEPLAETEQLLNIKPDLKVCEGIAESNSNLTIENRCSDAKKEDGESQTNTLFSDWERANENEITVSLSTMTHRQSYWKGCYEVLRNKGFLFYCTGLFLGCLTLMGVPLHLPEYAQTHGTSPQKAAALFVALGVGSLVSRICAGIATTDIRVDPLLLNMGLKGLCGVATATFPLYSNTYSGQMAYSAVFGLYTGGQIALFNVLIVKFLGVSLLNTGFGILNIFIGAGFLVGPPLAALIIDGGGTYEQSFYFLGCSMVTGSILDMVAGCMLT